MNRGRFGQQHGHEVIVHAVETRQGDALDDGISGYSAIERRSDCGPHA